jgi:hypothetical protein
VHRTHRIAPQTGAGGVRVDGFAPVQGGEPAAEFFVELRQLRGARGIVFFQKAKGFAHDLARGVVAAGFDFGADELFQFRGKGDVHGRLLLASTLAGIAKIVNV